MAKRSRFHYRTRAIKSEVERSLRLSEDFSVCLEAIYDAVERFSKHCVPLTISQIIRLKALHQKIWGYPVAMVNDMSEEEVRQWREAHE